MSRETPRPEREEPLDIVELTRAERLSLVDRLRGLPADAWGRPSLCDGWTVHHVLAHLTTPFLVSVPRFGLEILRAAGAGARLLGRLTRCRRIRPPWPAARPTADRRGQRLVARRRRAGQRTCAEPGGGDPRPTHCPRRSPRPRTRAPGGLTDRRTGAAAGGLTDGRRRRRTDGLTDGRRRRRTARRARPNAPTPQRMRPTGGLTRQPQPTASLAAHGSTSTAPLSQAVIWIGTVVVAVSPGRTMRSPVPV